jgi:hypothetical protein
MNSADGKQSDMNDKKIIENYEDSDKSSARKELELMIAGIADRMTHRKTVSNDASQPEQANEPLPLHERIKFLKRN